VRFHNTIIFLFLTHKPNSKLDLHVNDPYCHNGLFTREFSVVLGFKKGKIVVFKKTHKLSVKSAYKIGRVNEPSNAVKFEMLQIFSFFVH